jgi:hypothetical protein
MKHWIVAGALICAGMQIAQADWNGKPLLSGMRNDNDVTVQHVRDALTAFESVNKHWPATLDELAAFSQMRRIPLDLTAFDKANYAVQNQGGAAVAVFEFVLKGAGAKGAFAMANYIVK